MRKSLIYLVGGILTTYVGLSSYLEARNTYDDLRINSSIITTFVGGTIILGSGILEIYKLRKKKYFRRNQNYRGHSSSVQ